MRWLFRPGSQPEDAPQVLTLHGAAPEADEASGSPVQFLSDGGLRVNVDNATEARAALVALQHRQREFLASATRGAGSGVAAAGGALADGVVGSGRKARDTSSRVVRRFRFRTDTKSGSASTSMLASDSIDALLLLPQLTDGAIASVRLIGAAAQAIAEAVPDIDLSDFDFLDLLDF
jgi:hypothetical protein